MKEKPMLKKIWAKVQTRLKELSTPPITIEDATPDDVFAIRNVQRETWLATYPNKRLGITREDIASWFADDHTKAGRRRIEERKKNFEDPTIHTWVAKDEGEIIGFCLAKKTDDVSRIWAIYILPEYHGQGIGKKLMSAGLEWLGDDKDVYLDVASYNQKAIGFYERFGFVNSGREVTSPVAPLPSGKSIPEIEMVLRKK